MHLTDPLLDEGRTVYLDNWYSSHRFYTELLNMGTVQEKWVGLTRNIGKMVLKRGEMEVQQLPTLTYVI
jgi:hypothetical protein